MRKMGLEPTRCNHHKILSLARLPVPTLPQANNIISIWDINVKIKNEKFVKLFFSIFHIVAPVDLKLLFIQFTDETTLEFQKILQIHHNMI